MRIHLVSDLHLEFGKYDYAPPEADVYILAGDTCPGVAGVMWAMETYPKDKPVLYIPGNHEYYGKRIISKHLRKMKEKAANSNVHVMNNDFLIIDNVKFLGATLWTDYELYGDPVLAMMHAERKMNDHLVIHKDVQKPFHAVDALKEHVKSIQFLDDHLPDGYKVVVITHHAPSEQSVAMKYRNDPLTPAYASNLEKFIDEKKPTLWVHGHMHNSSDYMCYDTRVVANPRGYYGYNDLNQEFNPNLILEI